ncbi:AraC family transcriptional regulator [Pseudoalteromonas shioyasakiensis]|nr:AraC family transcriptional regulator [Pseudoalteromonas shioyasakiensis]
MTTNSVTPGFSKAILHILPALDVQLDANLCQQIQKFPSEGRLPMALQDALWQALTDLNDNELGLKIALSLKPDSYDMLGYLLFSCPTLGDAVDSLIAYSALIGEGGKFSKSHSKNGWKVTFDAFFSTPTAIRIEAVSCLCCLWREMDLWCTNKAQGGCIYAFSAREYSKLSRHFWRRRIAF